MPASLAPIEHRHRNWARNWADKQAQRSSVDVLALDYAEKVLAAGLAEGERIGHLKGLEDAAAAAFMVECGGNHDIQYGANRAWYAIQALIEQERSR